MSILVKPEDLRQEALWASKIRHEIHRSPEIGLSLPKTMAAVVRSLRECGVEEIHEGVGGEGVTGVVAVIRGERPGRTVGLRADADALALNEKTGKPWASPEPKHMHACGHDGHVATLLAVVRRFAARRDFAGTLVAIFQPGEEGFAGGRHMVEDGLVGRFGIEEFYALHSEPKVAAGKVAFVSGYATANADVFEIVFEGQGGHGSRPHLGRDPVVAASECVLALQTIASRNCNPDLTAIVSVCSIQSGNPSASSVMPQTATLIGTTRSFEPEVQDMIKRRMNEIAQGVAMTHGMKAAVRYTRLYPSMYDDPEMVRIARGLAEEALGADKVEDFYRTPGGEDFSFMLRERPGCLFRLGMRDAGPCHGSPLHSEMFDFNDDAIATGAAALCTIALNRMAA